MNVLDDAVSAYDKAFTTLTSKEAGASKSMVIELLIARDKIARALTDDQSPESGVLVRINELDLRLKKDAGRIAIIAGRSLADWRESFQPAESAWWWRLDAYQPSEPNFIHVRTLFALAPWICWISISVSLTYVLEVARRFVSTGADVPSIVLQGVLALLVGGAISQFVGQVAGRSSQSAGKSGLNPKSRILLAVLAIASVTTAVGIELFRSRIVVHYSNEGVANKQNGHLTAAIENYQRAISLKPNDSLAHYNLASVYEAVLEYDRAESEFQIAITCDDQYSVAYNRLARLRMLRRDDYVAALTLLETGLAKLDLMKEKNLVNDADDRDIRFAMLRNRAWANFGLGYFNQAMNDLTEALKLRPDGAVAHCLLGQVLESDKNPHRDQKAAMEEYRKCVIYSQRYNDNEENWLSLARERRLQPQTDSRDEKRRTK